MLRYPIKYASKRVFWGLMACVVSSVSGAADAAGPVVTVTPLLLTEPSSQIVTTDLSSVGTALTDPGALLPGSTLYVEIWFQTLGPAGIASALLNVGYSPASLNTSFDQITLASQWKDLWEEFRTVYDAIGLIVDLGGVAVSGQGLAPKWAKLATIEFDVKETKGYVGVCTFAGPDGGFGMVGIGEVEDVDYQCACLGVSTLDSVGWMVSCMTGPDVTVTPECMCADFDRNQHVDLADFAAFQLAFRGG